MPLPSPALAIWRTRGEHRPLIGEFAYQIRFQDRDKLSKDALRRAEAFFIALQYSADHSKAIEPRINNVISFL